MNELTEQDRKRLYIFLNEDMEALIKIGMDRGKFDHWRDLGSLKERLVEKRKWDSFEIYCSSLHGYYSGRSDKCSFPNWLFTPSRFAWLVSEWLKGEKEAT